jgi:hypothetical protein
MQEMDRRHDSWIAWRDLVLELAVIGLIGWEIYLGTQEDKVLTQLQDGSNATAAALMTVQGSSAAMSDAIQQQLGRTREVALSLRFESETNDIVITNTGQSDLVINSYHYGGGRGPHFKPPADFNAGETSKISAEQILKLSSWIRDKSYSTTFTLDLGKPDGSEFTATFRLSFVKLNDETHVIYSPAYIRKLHGPVPHKKGVRSKTKSPPFPVGFGDRGS